jgi:hypothetical protein
MTIQTINLGTYANDGTGDDLRTAFQKVNANFAELNSEINIGGAANIGTGAGVFAQKNGVNLEFKTLTSTNGTVAITNGPSSINLAASSDVSSDLTPRLGGNLDISGFKIIDSTFTGNIEAPIYGLDIPIMNSLIELMILSRNVDVNFGGIRLDQVPGWSADNPAGITIDMGYFGGGFPVFNNKLDFGYII